MNFVLHLGLILILPTVAMNNGDHLFMLMFPIAVTGALLNRYVMDVNSCDQQGRMPVETNEQTASFIAERRDYVSTGDNVRSPWLGDIIPVYIGKKLWRMFSIGDILVFAGCGLAWIYIGVIVIRGIRR